MVGISIFLLLSFCLFIILTRRIWIKIEKENDLELEIHFPILAICLTKSKARNATNTRIKRRTPTLSDYPRIISALSQLLAFSELEISKFKLPLTDNTAKIYKYHTFFYYAVAYLKEKTKKLTISTDGLILSPDVKRFSFDLTLKTELYRLLLCGIRLSKGIIKEKIKGNKNVGK